MGGADNGVHAGMRIVHAGPRTGKENAMDLTIRAPNLALDAGEVITVDDAEGLRIIARRGTVWVTEEGDSVDHIVGPGDTLIVAHPGRTVVQALQPAWISLGEGVAAANDGAWQSAGRMKGLL
jgi:hypothetical protein